MKLKYTLLLVLIALFGASQTAFGWEVEGVVFPDTYRESGKALKVRGAGLYRYIGFKVFVSALYLRPGDDATAVLSDVPKRLVIHYFHDIKAEDFVKLTENGLSKNLSTKQLAGIRSKVDKYNTLYKPVQPGDEYALTYFPGRGTELALNKQPLGVIKGVDFAASLYSIWLGSKPLSKSLKADLLGQ